MSTQYTLLPFRFERYDEHEYLLTNEIGEFVFMPIDKFNLFINGELDINSELFYDLASKQIATTDKVEDVVSMLATKYRTKKSILRDFTTLHMVVPTLRCNSSCIYCQVARKDMDAESVDMSKETAKKLLNLYFSRHHNTLRLSSRAEIHPLISRWLSSSSRKQRLSTY